MICTTPGCHGLVIKVPAYPPWPAHFRCQGPCGKPYKASAVKLERVEVPKFTEAKEVVRMVEEKALTKVCTKCGEEKPATADNFGKSKEGKLGLKSYCKACESKAASERWRLNHPEGKGSRGRRSQTTIVRPASKDGNSQAVAVRVKPPTPENSSIQVFFCKVHGTHETVKMVLDAIKERI